jgi:predicted nucleic acid-binding protein
MTDVFRDIVGLISVWDDSVALLHDLTLITHNTADFQDIPGLRPEDWLTP